MGYITSQKIDTKTSATTVICFIWGENSVLLLLLLSLIEHSIQRIEVQTQQSSKNLFSQISRFRNVHSLMLNDLCFSYIECHFGRSWWSGISPSHHLNSCLVNVCQFCCRGLEACPIRTKRTKNACFILVSYH